MNKVTDNVEFDFPARMADGRVFTDYRQNCTLNNSIAKNMNSWEYRNYLTENAAMIHDQNTMALEAQLKCNTCSDVTVLPAKTILNCSKDSCSYSMNDSSGLGQERRY